MTPDFNQAAVIDDAAAGTGHVVVQARAGSGKTSTILHAIARVPRGQSVLVCAFNSKIRAELAAKIDQLGLRAEVLTLHSYGARHCKAQLDQSKVYRIIDERLPGISREYAAAIRKGVSLAKGKLLRDAADVQRLIGDHGIDVPLYDAPSFGDDVLSVMTGCFYDRLSVDFDDQIWLPSVMAARGAALRQYDRVFIDETQDLNLCHIRLATAACRPGGRICAVGDDRQAIYAWRGADAHAIPRIIRELHARVLPLSVSYRCPREVVKLARALVPDIEHAPAAADGLVEPATEGQLLRAARPGDFVVSRKNAPLLKLCLRLIRCDRAAAVLGRDVGADLEAMVVRSRSRTLERLLRWVADWETRMVARARADNPDADVGRYTDAAECLRALSDGSGSVEEVRARIRRLFDEVEGDADRVTLMSTHKAKGLEAERVWLLRDTYEPSKSVEEENLLYVGVTRARRELYLVHGVS